MVIGVVAALEEKIYGLIEKMYVEFSGRFDHVEQRVDHISRRVELMEHRMDNIDNCLVNMESKFTSQIGILFDAQKAANDRLERLETKIDELVDKVERHDIKLNALEGGRHVIPL